MTIQLAARCAKCNRPMKAASPTGLGPTCLRNLTGAKPRRAKRSPARYIDERQIDWVQEARA